MKISIFWKIVFGFSILLIVMLGLSIYNMMMFNTTMTRYSNVLIRNQRLINDIRTVQVNFKRQVQEWKNILLRGHTPQDFETYTAAFQKKYTQVQNDVSAIPNQDISPEILAILKEFITEHQTLQQGYVRGLQLLKTGNEYRYQEADHLVRGLDRPPTELLDRLVDRVIEETAHRTQMLQQQGHLARNFSVGLLIVMAVIFMGVAFLTARRLSTPILLIRDVLKEVSTGNLNVRCDVTSQDEIGDLAHSTKNMIAYIQQVAEIIENVAHNDFDVHVVPRSEHDLLNHSLAQMVTKLSTTIRELEQMIRSAEAQNWVKEGLNLLNSALSGESSLENVSRKALSFAAHYVNAGHGVLYAYNAQKEILSLTGTYAFTEQDELAQTYRLGEGIIGQAARERTPIILKNVTRHDVEIRTGTISEAPLTTCTYPLLYDNELYGVLELAVNDALEEHHQHFLEGANRVIATTLFSAIQREKIQTLLQENIVKDGGSGEFRSHSR